MFNSVYNLNALSMALIQLFPVIVFSITCIRYLYTVYHIWTCSFCFYSPFLVLIFQQQEEFLLVSQGSWRSILQVLIRAFGKKKQNQKLPIPIQPSEPCSAFSEYPPLVLILFIFYGSSCDLFGFQIGIMLREKQTAFLGLDSGIAFIKAYFFFPQISTDQLFGLDIQGTFHILYNAFSIYCSLYKVTLPG